MCIIEKRTTFAKTYGIKMKCYGRHFVEHIGNLMKSLWELEGDLVRTHWELGKNEKSLSPPKT
jgi:hypothetical protein